MKKTATFRTTLPVVFKTREDNGERYLIGEASGPEIDATAERMAPEAIEGFAKQITDMAATGEPLTYRDAHMPDGVFRDLGEITRAWIDERLHMGIEIKLDKDSAAADFLWTKVKKGKKWGMSIAGMVRDYDDEYVPEAKRVIRTYKDIVLTEISNTSRPAWTPSFGTVLAKAIDEANAESETVETNVDDDLRQDEAEKASPDTNTENNEVESAAPTTDKGLLDGVENWPVEDQTGDDEALGDDEAQGSEKAAPDAAATEKAGDGETTEADEDVEKTKLSETAASASYSIASLVSLLAGESDQARCDDLRAAITHLQSVQSSAVAGVNGEGDQESSRWSDDTAEADVEKAGRTLSAANAKRLRELRDAFNSFLTDIGAEEAAPAKSDSSDAETNPDIEKAVADATTPLQNEVEELKRALTEKTARVEELEAMPASAQPPLVRHEDDDEKLRKAISEMSPSDRIRFGIALQRA